MNRSIMLLVATAAGFNLFGCNPDRNSDTVISTGNIGRHSVTCTVTDMQLDVDITLSPFGNRGGVTALSGIVTTDAGHIKDHTFNPFAPANPANMSVQLELQGVPPGRYVATSEGSGTTLLGGPFTLLPTSCDFVIP